MNRKAILGVTGLLAAASLAFGVGPAQAAREKPIAKVAILPATHLASGGAWAKLRISCDPVPGILWEGVLNAEQGDIFGYTELSLRSGICDGRTHVENVWVGPDDPQLSFGPGAVTLSVYIVDEDDNLKLYATDTRTVKLH